MDEQGGRTDEPRAAGAVAAAAATARREGRRLLARGAGLRLDPAAAAPARVVDMRPYNRVVRWAPEDLVAQVEAGATVAEVNRILADAGQWIPAGLPDGGDDTLGGLLAAGLDGFWRTGFGPLRERVLALTVWTPAFGVVRVGAPVVKNVAGYNLPRLYCGSLGAFGVILDVTLKLAPRPAVAAVWERELSGPEEAEPAATAFEAAGRPWTALLVTGDARALRFAAVWTGSRAAVARLADRLGAPQRTTWDALAPELAAPAAGFARFAGAVPRARAGELFRSVVRHGGWAAVDWSSGSFWALVPEPAGRPWTEAVRTLGGGVRPWRRPAVAEVGKAAGRPGLVRLKQAVDPDGVLTPLDAEEVGVHG
jgi:FAD/FMN-containing dehydrogenase